MRPIDGDALIDFLDVGHLRPPTELCFSELMVKNIVEMMPTIDPVRHGKWIYRDDDFDFYDTYTCSECDGEITVDSERHYDMGMVIEDVLYCPHCGSRNVVETWSVPMLKPREELR